MLHRMLLLMAAAVVTVPVSASAQFTLFTDRTTFLSAVSNPETDTFSDFPTGAVRGPIVRSVGPYSYRASTVGIGSFWGGDPGMPTGILSTSVQNASILFDQLGSSVRGFGGDFFGSNNGVLTDMTLDIVAATASGTLTQRLVSPGFNSFVGFVSTEAFTYVQILYVDGNFTSADNVVLAQARAEVPEPSSLALIGSGVLVLAVAAGRRRA